MISYSLTQLFGVFHLCFHLVHGLSAATCNKEKAMHHYHQMQGLHGKNHEPDNIGEVREQILTRLVATSTCLSDTVIEIGQNHVSSFNIPKGEAGWALIQYWNFYRNYICGTYTTEQNCYLPRHESQIQCNPNYPYRTIDGSCNNLQRPLWGAAEQVMNRYNGHFPDYEDGVSIPRGEGRPIDIALPRPRDVSVAMSNSPSQENTQMSLLLMQWGQYLDHDLVLTPESATLSDTSMLERVECCENDVHESNMPANCMPLDVWGDSFFQPHGVSCRRFVRSLATTRNCDIGVREQLSLLTAYIDASQVYGSSHEEEALIRSGIDGRIYSSGASENGACAVSNPFCFLPVYTNGEGETVFFTGDDRTQEQPGLVSMHTLTHRLHNYLAELYFSTHPNSQDEEIYQQIRRIVGAVFQRITYDEFLPKILGSQAMTTYGLWISPNSYSNAYNSFVDPTIFNVFATAAFRFGHSLVADFFELETRILPLNEHFERFNTTITQGQYPSDFLKGMSNTMAPAQDHVLVEALTNHLLSVWPYNFGSDLYALNIQRGRDHGLPPYNFWRQQCGLAPFGSFEEMGGYLRPEAIQALYEQYSGRIDDVDVFPAGLAEYPAFQNDGLLGPTFTCLIGSQFHNIRYGDRFWFDDAYQAYPFTFDQLTAIKQTTLASLICQFTTSSSIQLDAMTHPSTPGNTQISCNSQFNNVVEALTALW